MRAVPAGRPPRPPSPAGVLSHRSAAVLGELWRTDSGGCAVTVPSRRAPRSALRFHVASLAGDEVTVIGGIPVTTVARTILDLAATVRPSELTRMIERAELRRHCDPVGLPALVARYPGRRGVGRLRSVLQAMEGPAPVTRSELEARFRSWLERHRLPAPRHNALLEVGGRRFECDCVWPGAGVIVELDGHGTHGGRLAFERDRARDRALQAAGWRVIRVTWRQLHGDARLAADLRAALEQAARRPGRSRGGRARR